MTDETEYISEAQEARIDAGDLLDPAEVCSFRERLAVSGLPCAHHATGVRTMNDVDFPACDYHRVAGGFLTDDGRRRLALGLVAAQNVDASASIVTDDGERVTFATICAGCGRSLFPGNTSGRCSECQPLVLSGAQLIAEHRGDVEAADRGDYFRNDPDPIAHFDGSWMDR